MFVNIIHYPPIKEGNDAAVVEHESCDNKCQGARTMKGMHFISEIAQLELSDIQRIPSTL
jgi:hypothetical protein